MGKLGVKAQHSTPRNEFGVWQGCMTGMGVAMTWGWVEIVVMIALVGQPPPRKAVKKGIGAVSCGLTKSEHRI